MKFIFNKFEGDRIIIFDSSSLLASTEPAVLSKYVDGVLLVVEAEKTTPNDLKRAIELLDGTTILGTILNKATGESK